jgi:aspartate aminotransferase-like enzyme
MRTKNPAVILTASGTGAMEAALVNLTKPGEKALVISIGKFSDRWRELANAYGLDVVVLEAKWGDPMDPQRVEDAMKSDPGINTVFTAHSETSTGVLQDIKSISRIAHAHGALMVVDGITSLCAQVVDTDNWQLDVVIGGSQKGFFTPPGISFLSISEAARERIEQGRHPVYYFDLNKALKKYDAGDTPWTPAATLIIALDRALQMIEEEGLENVIRRHTRNAKGVRLAAKALGLKLLASIPCNATTAVVPKEGTANAVRARMEEGYGVKVAGGQGELKGRIIRLGHLGLYGETDMYTMISALEAAMADLGHSDVLGRGVEALLHFFQEEK